MMARQVAALRAARAWAPARAASRTALKQKLSVILLEDVERLGRRGEQVEVKPGFARNFLLPSRRAVYATPDNKRLYLSGETVQRVVAEKSEAAVAEEWLRSRVTHLRPIFRRNAAEPGGMTLLKEVNGGHRAAPRRAAHRFRPPLTRPAALQLAKRFADKYDLDVEPSQLRVRGGAWPIKTFGAHTIDVALPELSEPAPLLLHVIDQKGPVPALPELTRPRGRQAAGEAEKGEEKKGEAEGGEEAELLEGEDARGDKRKRQRRPLRRYSRPRRSDRRDRAAAAAAPKPAAAAAAPAAAPKR
jgi:hypothetical protein